MIPISDEIRTSFLHGCADFISLIGSAPSDMHVILFDTQDGATITVNKTTQPDYHTKYPLSRFFPVMSYLNPHITIIDLPLLGNLTAVPATDDNG